jgi:hypothetical protein
VPLVSYGTKYLDNFIARLSAACRASIISLPAHMSYRAGIRKKSEKAVFS